MTEVLIHGQNDTDPITPENSSAAEQRAAAERFVHEVAPILKKVTGLDVAVGVGTGWATNLETAAVTIDPTFFLERGYSPDDSFYAMMHELLAHVRDAVRDPEYALKQIEFARTGKAEAIFNNIITDIAGNRQTHALLPRQAQVGANLYNTKLFPVEKDGERVDYTKIPLHLQFLYKMIRQAMIPGDDLEVRPEVDEALAELRNYKGAGDVVEYLTRPDSKLSGAARFERQKVIIYPVYKKLLEQDREEAAKKPTDDTQQGSDGQPNEGTEGDNNEQQPDTQDNNTSGGGNSNQDDPFEDDYRDYFDTKHPEPLDEEDHDALEEAIRNAIKNRDTPKSEPQPVSILDAQRREEGLDTVEYADYRAAIERDLGSIDEMRATYASVIETQIALRRGVSRAAYREGDVIDLDRLPQTIADVQAGVSEPLAYNRYEQVRGHAEYIGRTDYLFAFDCSRSMLGDEKHVAAARAALIALEGLAAIERDIAEAERQNTMNLELDVRTGLYTFRTSATCLKQLGPGLSDRERLSVRSSLLSPRGTTADDLALRAIDEVKREPGRRRIVIVITDGESNEPSATNREIRKLRRAGDLVFGIGIGPEAVIDLYAPNATRIIDPADLPAAVRSLIESSMK